MSTEKAKRKLTPEEIQDTKKREMFQRISWAGVLEPVEERLGAKILRDGIEGEVGRMESSIGIGEDTKQWILTLRIFLGAKSWLSKARILFYDDGKVLVFGAMRKSEYPSLYKNDKPDDRIKQDIKERLARL